MEDKLKEIFQRCFGVEELDDSMSIENVKGWDSMAHVGLIMELQKEFSVTISPVEAIELTDVGSIKDFLTEKC